MRRLSIGAGVAIGLLSQPSCHSVTEPDLAGTVYTVALINGASLPFALDTVEGTGGQYEIRLLARSLVVGNHNSIQYTEAIDNVRLLPGGTREAAGSSCFSRSAVYTIDQDRIAIYLNTTLDSGTPLVRYDTLVIIPDSLIQAQHGRRMAFRTGTSGEADCVGTTTVP